MPTKMMFISGMFIKRKANFEGDDERVIKYPRIEIALERDSGDGDCRGKSTPGRL